MERTNTQGSGNCTAPHANTSRLTQEERNKYTPNATDPNVLSINIEASTTKSGASNQCRYPHTDTNKHGGMTHTPSRAYAPMHICEDAWAVVNRLTARLQAVISPPQAGSSCDSAKTHTLTDKGSYTYTASRYVQRQMSNREGSNNKEKQLRARTQMHRTHIDTQTHTQDTRHRE